MMLVHFLDECEGIISTRSINVYTAAFLEGTEGGKNVDVWRFMLEQHPPHVVVGSSTHNQCIK